MSTIAGFCNPESLPLDYNATNPSEGQHVKLRTTAEIHRRIAFVLGAMRDLTRARVSIKVLRLEGKGSVGDAVLAPEKAKLRAEVSEIGGHAARRPGRAHGFAAPSAPELRRGL